VKLEMGDVVKVRRKQKIMLFKVGHVTDLVILTELYKNK
jgi:hypothetical protein